MAMTPAWLAVILVRDIAAQIMPMEVRRAVAK